MGLCDESDFEVRGHCPACGQQYLTVSANELTCLATGCPAPDTAHKLLQDSETEHLVKFHGEGFFTVQHPLRERVDGSLLLCDIHNVVTELIDMDMAPTEMGVRRLVATPAVYLPGGPDQEPDWEWQEVDDD
jgi:hypothetical protein